MDVASARMYIAMLSVMSLHNASAPAWILLRNHDVIGAIVHDVVPLLKQHRHHFSWMFKQHPMTLIGTQMPSEMAAHIIVTMNITTVFYLTPPASAKAAIIITSSGRSMKRLLLV